MPTDVQTLNEICKPFLIEVERDLNKNSLGAELELMPGNFYHIPFVEQNGNAQIISRTDEAFSLDEPRGTIIRDQLKTLEILESPVVIRRVLSYANAYKIIQNPEKVKRFLYPLVYEMISTLKREKHYGPETLNYGFYGTFFRPGTERSIFRELENYAGYEIRLYSDTQKCAESSL